MERQTETFITHNDGGTEVANDFTPVETDNEDAEVVDKGKADFTLDKDGAFVDDQLDDGLVFDLEGGQLQLLAEVDELDVPTVCPGHDAQRGLLRPIAILVSGLQVCDFDGRYFPFYRIQLFFKPVTRLFVKNLHVDVGVRLPPLHEATENIVMSFKTGLAVTVDFDDVPLNFDGIIGGGRLVFFRRFDRHELLELGPFGQLGGKFESGVLFFPLHLFIYYIEKIN